MPSNRLLGPHSRLAERVTPRWPCDSVKPICGDGSLSNAGFLPGSARLQASTRLVLDGEGERVSFAAGKLDSLSPLGVLARGYAIAFDSQGKSSSAL
jgi:hypothetical protein